MTGEELDKARSDEAWRIWKSYAHSLPRLDHITVATIGARLAREGWVPVDPDLIKAREICAEAHPRGLIGGSWGPHVRDGYIKGHYDCNIAMLSALSGIKYGRSQGDIKS